MVENAIDDNVQFNPNNLDEFFKGLDNIIHVNDDSMNIIINLNNVINNINFNINYFGDDMKMITSIKEFIEIKNILNSNYDSSTKLGMVQGIYLYHED